MNFTCMVDSLQRYEIPSTNDCILPLMSEILGYIIVAGASIVKLPQIVLILRNRSAKGLSLTSFELEVVCFTISLAYCLWKRLPFSAYGELVFLLLQGIILLIMIYYYTPNLGLSTWLKSAIYCAVAPQLLAGNLNEILFETLYTKSTGQLSFLTIFLSFGRGAVRLLTLIQARAPGLMLMGSFIGFLTNGAVIMQIIFYENGSPKKTKAA